MVYQFPFEFMHQLSWVATFLITFLVYLFTKYHDRGIGTKRRNDPKYHDRPGLPLLGHLAYAIYNARHPLEWATETTHRYGPGWSITVPGTRLIDVTKPEWIEHVQKKNFSNYVKGSPFQEVMSDVFGEGIFVSDGPKWKAARQCTVRLFSANSFREIIQPSMDGCLHSLVQSLRYSADHGSEVDFSSIFHSFTLECFVHIIFGKKLGLLHPGSSSSETGLSRSSIAFAQSFDFAQNHINWRFAVRIGWSRIEAFFPSVGKPMQDACKTLDDYVYSLIDERNQKSSEATSEKHVDLLGLFMKTVDVDGGRLSRVELKDAAINMMIAGRDTTAQALSWTFFHLIMNPKWIQRIRAEINSIDPTNRTTGRVNYDNYKRFASTQAVIYEALRLHPSIPKNLKLAIGDDQIPNGPKIHAGDAIRWSDWQMGRDPTVWGDDCGFYKPERWISPEGKLNQFGQFKFHVFNGGPRHCLGMRLAMLEAVAVVVAVLDEFDLQFAPGWLESVPKSKALPGLNTGYPTPHYKPSISHPMEQPMLIKLIPQKNQP